MATHAQAKVTGHRSRRSQRRILCTCHAGCSCCTPAGSLCYYPTESSVSRQLRRCSCSSLVQPMPPSAGCSHERASGFPNPGKRGYVCVRVHGICMCHLYVSFVRVMASMHWLLASLQVCCAILNCLQAGCILWHTSATWQCLAARAGTAAGHSSAGGPSLRAALDAASCRRGVWVMHTSIRMNCFLRIHTESYTWILTHKLPSSGGPPNLRHTVLPLLLAGCGALKHGK